MAVKACTAVIRHFMHAVKHPHEPSKFRYSFRDVLNPIFQVHPSVAHCIAGGCVAPFCKKNGKKLAQAPCPPAHAQHQQLRSKSTQIKRSATALPKKPPTEENRRKTEKRPRGVSHRFSLTPAQKDMSDAEFDNTADIFAASAVPFF
ncbi:MAG: hypothetical protein MHM6MM_000592 [Cercozoa sp. M6MM]